MRFAAGIGMKKKMIFIRRKIQIAKTLTFESTRDQFLNVSVNKIRIHHSPCLEAC